MKSFVTLVLATAFALLSEHPSVNSQVSYQASSSLADPNQIVYQQIYHDAVNGQIPVQQVTTREVQVQPLPQAQYQVQQQHQPQVQYQLQEQPQSQVQLQVQEEPQYVDDGALQEMYTELFQTPTNRRLGATQPTALDECAKQVEIPADTLLYIADSAPRQQFFFGMNHAHVAGMGGVKRLLLDADSAQDAICMARALRDHTEINRHAWLRGVVSAAMARPDMAHLAHPPLAEIMPSLLINSPAIDLARRQAGRGGVCAAVDGTVGQVNGIENRLWYFREDVLMNSGHWFWHLSNPFSHERLEVPVSSRPDRRGELFYYFHTGILARYHAERLANGLPPSIPLHLTEGTVLPEPYYAFLTDANSAAAWSDRPPNTRLRSLVSNRDFVNHPANISIAERSEYLRRLDQAIRAGAMVDRNGRHVPLDSYSGIDLLGEAVEASIWSVNPQYYGEFGIHNDGHFLIGLVGDPDDTLRIPPAVMADGATAMRDPIFYTYHLTIDALFDQHKKMLEPYKPEGGEWPLHWPEVEVTDVRVTQDGTGAPNQLNTFWNEKQVNLVRGLDFNRSDSNGSVFACVRHLDHKPFTYQILVHSKPGHGHGHGPSYGGFGGGSRGTQKATVRIFMGLRNDAHGRRYTMSEQRKFFFPVDHFTVELKPGHNTITRRSVDSAMTIPWPQSYEELERDSGRRLTPYCGCGWPQHLLLPKGTPQGQIFDLFVMITDGDEDAVQRSDFAGRGRVPTRQGCRAAPIYCGVAGQPYPDARPMNYPFDRLPCSMADRGGAGGNAFQFFPSSFSGGFGGGPSHTVQNLDEYTFGISNIGTTQVTIRHIDSDNSGGGGGGGGFPGSGFPGQLPGPVNFGGLGGSGSSASASSSSSSSYGSYGPFGGFGSYGR